MPSPKPKGPPIPARSPEPAASTASLSVFEGGDFERLRRFLTFARGRNAFAIARFRDPAVRDAVTGRLAREFQVEGRDVAVLPLAGRRVGDLFAPVQDAVAERPSPPDALFVTGLEATLADTERGPALLTHLNLQRDFLAQSFEFPIVLFLPDKAADLVLRGAPDFVRGCSAYLDFGTYTLPGLERGPASGARPPAVPARGERPATPATAPSAGLRVLYLMAQPLVDHAGLAVPRLALGRERDAVVRWLRETEAPVEIRFEVAAPERLQELLLGDWDVLHFSGHGSPEGLLFETETGRGRLLRPEELGRLLVRGERPPVSLVTLSACHSASSANAVATAGVRHILTIDAEQALLDDAAIRFAAAFYGALARGFLVSDAFEEGRKAVAISGGHGAAEEMKFQLLPGTVSDHRQPLVSGEGDRPVPPIPPQLAVRRGLPAPNPHFVGRADEMVLAIQALRDRRWLTLRGSVVSARPSWPAPSPTGSASGRRKITGPSRAVSSQPISGKPAPPELPLMRSRPPSVSPGTHGSRRCSRRSRGSPA
jgi:hypothetical protein